MSESVPDGAAGKGRGHRRVDEVRLAHVAAMGDTVAHHVDVLGAANDAVVGVAEERHGLRKGVEGPPDRRRRGVLRDWARNELRRSGWGMEIRGGT